MKGGQWVYIQRRHRMMKFFEKVQEFREGEAPWWAYPTVLFGLIGAQVIATIFCEMAGFR